jgi:hypothetical protein
MTHTSEVEERAAGKEVRAGAPMVASAFRALADAVPNPATPRAATGRGVVVSVFADAPSARPGHSGRAGC